MIKKLTIDNYALIDKSVIDFQEGFTVITGETGAGKSIMLDALGLLMGARADSKAMGNRDRKTIVEAIFSNPDISLKSILEDNGIDWDAEELILRREISGAGKSRGFINDTPVNLSFMESLSEHILDIHSQHSNSLLNKPNEQLAIIDSFGNTQELLENYQTSFKEYVALHNKIKRIKEGIAKGKENKEFILFRLEQLNKLKPKKGELAVLEREAEILGDADRIKTDLNEAYSLLAGSGPSVLKQLQLAASALDNIDFNLLDSEGNDNITERLNSLKIELRDISDTLEGYSEMVQADPMRYEKIQARIESIYELMKRLKVKDEEELVELHQRLKEELESIEGGNTDISAMEHQLKDLAKGLKDKAEVLSDARRKAAEEFEKTIIDKIIPLGLPNVKFKVEIQKGKLASEGQDSITFYCSFNKNHPMQPVANIASGGEIARVMLGIKSVMAESMNLPTIIFDEIDTGVSGEIAHKMGKLMKQMSKKIQVVAVTHLPQVASNGNSHLKVYKDDNEEKTISHIKVLDENERIKEIAGMLSGDTINEVALENARMLLKSV